MNIKPFSDDISTGNNSSVKEAPVVEAPITEIPSTEIPSTEIPAIEIPVIEIPISEQTEQKEEETGAFSESYPTIKEWNKKVREVGKTYKLSPEQINGLIMGIASSVAGVSIPGYYKQTLHEKVLRDMGYNRKTLKRMQDFKGGLPPWYKALEIDPRNPEFDIIQKVKAGLSVNEAWKAMRRAKFGEFYHKDKGWY